jgi:hypothetical protein
MPSQAQPVSRLSRWVEPGFRRCAYTRGLFRTVPHEPEMATSTSFAP